MIEQKKKFSLEQEKKPTKQEKENDEQLSTSER